MNACCSTYSTTHRYYYWIKKGGDELEDLSLNPRHHTKSQECLHVFETQAFQSRDGQILRALWPASPMETGSVRSSERPPQGDKAGSYCGSHPSTGSCRCVWKNGCEHMDVPHTHTHPHPIPDKRTTKENTPSLENNVLALEDRGWISF